MKKVLITGASRGIGREIALHFAAAGYEVGVCYNRAETEAQRLKEEIDKTTKAHLFCADLSDLSAVFSMAHEVRRTMGRVDVLINNAGVSSYGILQDLTEEEYDRVFDTNVKAMIFLTRELLPDMICAKRGSIINLSSVWGQTGASCEVLYSASKAAVIGFTKALAKELAPSGVRVNCIAPGVVETDMISSFSTEEKRDLANDIPAQRLAHPAEIAPAALFLADCDQPYLTGQVLGVNGGFYL